MTDTSLTTIDPAELSQLLDKPALTPPPGVTPNFEHPPNWNTLTYAVVGISITLVAISASFRIIGRWIFSKQFNLADYLLLPLLGLYAGVIYVLLGEAAFPGTFVHQWNVQIGKLPIFLYNIFIGTCLVCALLPTVKVAILQEWVGLFVPRGTRNYIFWTCHLLTWINILFYVAVLISVNLACTPYERNWNNLIQGDCSRVNTNQTNLAAAFVNFISDFIILIIPQRAIWKLHLPIQKRIGVAVVFALGITAFIAATFRVAVSVQHLRSRDYTYTFSEVSLCVVGEFTCAFLVLCVPSAPLALKAFRAPGVMRRLRGDSSARRRSQTVPTKKEGDEWPRQNLAISGTNGYVEITTVQAHDPQLPMTSTIHQVEEDLAHLNVVEPGIFMKTEFGIAYDYDPKSADSRV
ncbi:hypothetical protein F4802DRAFT_186505 [Xylaria palmicola]|nr:hypothetical protein F4802DRAFT_186505 [Xylaria palmicola]